MDCCYGIIPCKRFQGKWWVLVVQHYHGGWGFPKGHVEAGETPQQGATRELHEETGLTILRTIDNVPFEETYRYSTHKGKQEKKVTYWLAVVEGPVQLSPPEIVASKWVFWKDLKEHVTFPEAKELVSYVIDQILQGSLGSSAGKN